MRRPELRSARPPPPPPCGPPPERSSTRAGRRRDLARLVVDEVEIEDVVVVHGHRQNPGRAGGARRSVEPLQRSSVREIRRRRTFPWYGEGRLSVSSAAFAVPDRALVLDRYRPLKPLGRGGSGSVWLAQDEQTGLEVALKIVPREGKRAARAAREMEAASRLRHERCVRAYDFGGDTGHVYIAYEYVRGRTLREVLRAEEVDDAGAVEIAAQMLDGLAHAHRRGIVHRDVKPSNVLVEDTDDISVRVLDFGLAQFDEADTLTAVGDVPGTLAYISPERLSGKEASERSDVWAVGVILWEALAGSHPFWGVPLPQVASTIASGAPPLSARRGDLPRRLLAAIDAALSVDPAKRPQAARLAADLREAFVVPLTRTRPERKPARAARVAKPPRPKAAPVPLWQRLAPAGMASLATAGRRLAGAVLAGTAPRRARGSRGPRRVPCPTPRARRCPGGAGVPARERRAGGCRRLRLPRARLVGRDLARPTSRSRLLGRSAPRCARAPAAPAPGRPTRPRLVASWPACRRRGLCGGRRRRPRREAAAVDRNRRRTTSGSRRRSGRRTCSTRSARCSATTTAIATTALALGIVSALLPWALSRGQWGIVGLGALQLMLVFAWAPSIPWVGFVFGTLLLCGLLVARPYLGTILRRSGG